MDVEALQRGLAAAGVDPGPVDGRWGPRTRKALMTALRGASAPLAQADIDAAAAGAGLEPAMIGAVLEVESNGRGFDPITRLPIILYEPHQFSRLTSHRFDDAAPAVSYRAWGAKPYPRTQEGRYEQLMTAVGLDPGAALGAASWGLFQIMGYHWKALGHADPLAFVLSMARNEAGQLAAFIAFVRENGLLAKLKAKDWAGFARGYNGPGYATNRYDAKLASAYARHAAR